MATYLKEYSKMQDEFAIPPGKHEIILMLLNGVVQKIDAARDAHARAEFTEKGFYLGRATGIVDALRNMLDVKSGDQAAIDLDIVYNHVDLLLQSAIDPEGLNYLDEAVEIMENLAIGCNILPLHTENLAAVMHA